MTGCTCKEPGWCDRHQCTKHARWHQLCQTDQTYFDSWEAGTGPGQRSDNEGQSETRRKQCGPGCHLSRLLAKFGITDKAGCNCKSHAAEMDCWGPDTCLLRIDQILDWMNEEAEKRKLKFVRTAAYALVRVAIWRARRELTHVNA
jgi:hypothetical protein